MTEIDGVDIHFIHVKSPHEDALPLIMTHGWPGSVIELLETVGPLTDPTAHGGRAEDAFHLVLPSLPGYGFSGEPTELGWDAGRIARAWAELMRRLGYTRYVAQGGDVGAVVTDAMGRQAPDGLLGIHMNLLVTALASGPQPTDTDEERAALTATPDFQTSGNGYFIEQATRPQTVGYATLDSPIALAAWMLDHDTDAYYKISRAFVDGQSAGNLTRDHVLDNITLYWLTGTGASAARSYWESYERPPAPRLTSPRRRSRFRSASPRSRVSSCGPRAAGSTSVRERHLLQRGRQGRALRCLGRAGRVQRRGSRHVQIASLANVCMPSLDAVGAQERSRDGSSGQVPWSRVRAAFAWPERPSASRAVLSSSAWVRSSRALGMAPAIRYTSAASIEVSNRHEGTWVDIARSTASPASGVAASTSPR